jgi:hypothetical protein
MLDLRRRQFITMLGGGAAWLIWSIIEGRDRVPPMLFDCTGHDKVAKFSCDSFRGPNGTLSNRWRTEEDMNRHSLLTTSVPIMLAAALVLPSSIVAQEITLKELLGS